MNVHGAQRRRSSRTQIATLRVRLRHTCGQEHSTLHFDFISRRAERAETLSEDRGRKPRPSSAASTLEQHSKQVRSTARSTTPKSQRQTQRQTPETENPDIEHTSESTQSRSTQSS